MYQHVLRLKISMTNYNKGFLSIKKKQKTQSASYNEQLVESVFITIFFFFFYLPPRSKQPLLFSLLAS